MPKDSLNTKLPALVSKEMREGKTDKGKRTNVAMSSKPNNVTTTSHTNNAGSAISAEEKAAALGLPVIPLHNAATTVKSEAYAKRSAAARAYALKGTQTKKKRRVPSHSTALEPKNGGTRYSQNRNHVAKSQVPRPAHASVPNAKYAPAGHHPANTILQPPTIVTAAGPSLPPAHASIPLLSSATPPNAQHSQPSQANPTEKMTLGRSSLYHSGRGSDPQLQHNQQPLEALDAIPLESLAEPLISPSKTLGGGNKRKSFRGTRGEVNKAIAVPTEKGTEKGPGVRKISTATTGTDFSPKSTMPTSFKKDSIGTGVPRNPNPRTTHTGSTLAAFSSTAHNSVPASLNGAISPKPAPYQRDSRPNFAGFLSEQKQHQRHDTYHDDEYAKFVRSLWSDEDDMASLVSLKPDPLSFCGVDDDDDDEFQLQSEEEDEDDDDEDERAGGVSESNQEVAAERSIAADNGIVDKISVLAVAAANSGSENGEKLDGSTSRAVGKGNETATHTAPVDPASVGSLVLDSTNTNASSSTSTMFSVGESRFSVFGDSHGSVDECDDLLYAELEAELGSLLEEDLEAAVSTLLGDGLIQGPSQLDKGNGHTTSPLLAPPAQLVGESALSQNARLEMKMSGTLDTDDQKRGKRLRRSISISPPTPSAPFAPPQTPSCRPDIASGDEGPNSGSAHGRRNRVATSSSAPTSAQIEELRALMSRHYQILLQQAILAVRAAQIQRTQKENHQRVSPSNSSTGPNSKGERGGRKKGKSKVSSAAQMNCFVVDTAHTIGSVSSNCFPHKNDMFFCGETADDLVEILDGAVGMLQDLDEQRKDALRTLIQLEETVADQPCKKSLSLGGRGLPMSALRSMHSNMTLESPPSLIGTAQFEGSGRARILTRSAFSKTLRERENVSSGGAIAITDTAQMDATEMPSKSAFDFSDASLRLAAVGRNDRISNDASTFDVRGLSRLNQTFASIDNSVNGAGGFVKNGEVGLLDLSDHGEACVLLLRQAGAFFDEKFVPGRRGLAELFSFSREVFGERKELSISKEEEQTLRKNKGQFTAAEDNLVLKGVNLYGEKEWLLISDRYLPDRSVSVISQRYSRLCVLLYRSHGVVIDEHGNLPTPPEHPNGVEDFDEAAISKLSVVDPPAQCNVHRWSLEEDVTLLKAVPLMGHMWAEVASRLIQHRDRGHLRKRYQVLERRVKAAHKREKKLMLEIAKVDRRVSDPKAPTTKRLPSMKAPGNTAKANGRKKKSQKQVASSTNMNPVPQTNGVMPSPGSSMHVAPYVHSVSPMMPYPMGVPPVPGVMHSMYLPPGVAPTSACPAGPAGLAFPSPLSPALPHTDLSIKDEIISPPESAKNVRDPAEQMLAVARQGSVNLSFELSNEKTESSTSNEMDQKDEGFFCMGVSSSPFSQAGPKAGSHQIPPQRSEQKDGAEQHATELQTLSTPIIKSRTPSHSMSSSTWSQDSYRLPISSGQTENTRTGFERIINDDDAWSQQSRMKKLIENDTTSPMATPKFHIGGGESGNSSRTAQCSDTSISFSRRMARLPNLRLETPSNTFSILDGFDKDDSNGGGLNQSDSKNDRPAGNTTMGAIFDRLKDGQATSSNSSHLHQTPLRAGIVNGSPMMKQKSVYHPSSEHAPSGSICDDNSRLRVAGESPHALSSSMTPGIIKDLCGSDGLNMEALEFSNISMSERSRQAMEGNTSALRMSPNSEMPPFSPTFSNGHPCSVLAVHSLMAKDDLDAVAALGSMSNSSRTPLASPLVPGRTKQQSAEKKVSKKKTFFETVVDAVEEKDAKRKRCD